MEWQEHAGADASDDDASFRAWGERLVRVWDPPAFRSLGDLSALRQVAVTLYPEARRWADSGPSHPTRHHREGHFPWEMVSRTAKAVAAERGVKPGAVHGVVMVLDVEGMWLRRAAPGAVLCSTGAAEDRPTATAALREAFQSGLG